MDSKQVNSEHTDEQELIKKVQEKDRNAFNQLVKKYMERAYAIAYRITHNHHDAQDLSQEAFIKVWNSINSFTGKSSFYTWFYRILVNLCIDFQRKHSFLKIFYTSDSNSDKNPEMGHATHNIWQNSSNQENPEKSLLNKELEYKINNALKKLPAKQKVVFELKYYQGLQFSEIAKILKCSEGTVKSHMFRSTRKLQKLLVQTTDIRL
ncbi:MAG: sigma-70 family RNA polymerase sigma factor [Candidatus Firestonebacteria bacterium]